MEAYDGIVRNYWAATSTYDLPAMFQAALGKQTNSLAPLLSDDREGTAKMLAGAFGPIDAPAAKKKLALDTLSIVLNNLQPLGRNSLASNEQVTSLRENVSNVDPTADLFGELGIASTSAAQEIKVAYNKQMAALESTTSAAGKQKIDKVAYAYKVLANENTKSLYKSAGVEPSTVNNVLGRTLYIHLSKMSPTVVQEFAWDIDAASTTAGLDSMIIDLRGNVGGATDTARGLTGLFLGANQYAFDLFHQGDYQVQRTIFSRFEELGRYREIAVLTDGLTQSTAEVMTEVLTHFNIAHSVGLNTRGWGTVENTYPLQTAIDPSTSYALLLVNSITLRDDGEPIEGRGITPDVDTSKADWKTRLNGYFSSPDLIKAVKTMIAKPLTSNAL
jgi:hypothetical protein